MWLLLDCNENLHPNQCFGKKVGHPCRRDSTRVQTQGLVTDMLPIPNLSTDTVIPRDTGTQPVMDSNLYHTTQESKIRLCLALNRLLIKLRKDSGPKREHISNLQSEH